MAHSQPGGFAGQNARFMAGSGEDLGALAAVLQDVMPVLARIQTRSTGPGFPGRMTIESAAALAFVSDLGADSLRRLTAYLDAQAEKFQGLESCAAIVAEAARALAARDYAQAFTHLFEVYRIIAVLRGDDPALPAPGALAPVPPDKRDSTEAEAEARKN